MTKKALQELREYQQREIAKAEAQLRYLKEVHAAIFG
jgi:hypothetical protein